LLAGWLAVTTAPSSLQVSWVTVFLDYPANSVERGTRFWQDATGYGLSPIRGEHGQFATLLPPDGDAYLRLQRLGDGVPRVHLDLNVDLTTTTLDDAGAAAAALGAVVLRQYDDLVVLESPGGFVFCLVGWDGEHVPPSPVATGAAGVQRADQVCLDIPPGMEDAERAFWAALTGWTPRESSVSNEFSSLERPAEIPVRMLFQRRREAEPGDRVSAHVDFACDDREALVEQHRRAGAVELHRGPVWITLREPGGQVYCLTGRDPRTGKVPPR
jgi:hypothetical protein